MRHPVQEIRFWTAVGEIAVGHVEHAETNKALQSFNLAVVCDCLAGNVYDEHVLSRRNAF